MRRTCDQAAADRRVAPARHPSRCTARSDHRCGHGLRRVRAICGPPDPRRSSANRRDQLGHGDFRPAATTSSAWPKIRFAVRAGRAAPPYAGRHRRVRHGRHTICSPQTAFEHEPRVVAGPPRRFTSPRQAVRAALLNSAPERQEEPSSQALGRADSGLSRLPTGTQQSADPPTDTRFRQIAHINCYWHERDMQVGSTRNHP